MRTTVPSTIADCVAWGRAAGKIRAVVTRSDASQGAIVKKSSEDFGFKITRAVMHPALNSQNLGGIRKKASFGIVSFNKMRDKIERIVSRPRAKIRNCRPLGYLNAAPLIHNKVGKTR